MYVYFYFGFLCIFYAKNNCNMVICIIYFNYLERYFQKIRLLFHVVNMFSTNKIFLNNILFEVNNKSPNFYRWLINYLNKTRQG